MKLQCFYIFFVTVNGVNSNYSFQPTGFLVYLSQIKYYGGFLYDPHT